MAIGKATMIDFTLNVGGVAEQVTVEADAARIDTGQSTIQTNVTAAARSRTCPRAPTWAACSSSRRRRAPSP